jgi:hypothetical protein
MAFVAVHATDIASGLSLKSPSPLQHDMLAMPQLGQKPTWRREHGMSASSRRADIASVLEHVG